MNINSQILSLNAQNNLSQGLNNQSNMERLSSGLRVNTAKDDSAGLAIASRLGDRVTLGSSEDPNPGGIYSDPRTSLPAGAPITRIAALDTASLVPSAVTEANSKLTSAPYDIDMAAEFAATVSRRQQVNASINTGVQSSMDSVKRLLGM